MTKRVKEWLPEKEYWKQYIKEWKAKKEKTVKVYGRIYYENYLKYLEEELGHSIVLLTIPSES